jgi:hypothetical protein
MSSTSALDILGASAMTQLRIVSRNERVPNDLVLDHRNRMRGNLLAAVVTATLLIAGGWLADELAEASQSCYPPDGGCEARGVPVPTVGFDEMMSNR